MKRDNRGNKIWFNLFIILVTVLWILAFILVAVYFKNKVVGDKEAERKQYEDAGYLVLEDTNGNLIPFDTVDAGEIEGEVPDYTVSENTMIEWETQCTNKLDRIVNYITNKEYTIDYTDVEIEEETRKALESIKTTAKEVYVADEYIIENNDEIYVNKVVGYTMIADGTEFELQILKFHDSDYIVEIMEYNNDFAEKFMYDTVCGSEYELEVIESQLISVLSGFLENTSTGYRNDVIDKLTDRSLIEQLDIIKEEVNDSKNHFKVSVLDNETLNIDIFNLSKNGITYDIKSNYKIKIGYNVEKSMYMIKGVE